MPARGVSLLGRVPVAHLLRTPLDPVRGHPAEFDDRVRLAMDLLEQVVELVDALAELRDPPVERGVRALHAAPHREHRHDEAGDEEEHQHRRDSGRHEYGLLEPGPHRGHLPHDHGVVRRRGLEEEPCRGTRENRHMCILGVRAVRGKRIRPAPAARSTEAHSAVAAAA